jgi:hypothetical protein
VGLNTTVTFSRTIGSLWKVIRHGFAPQIYDREHVKYFGGAGGIDSAHDATDSTLGAFPGWRSTCSRKLRTMAGMFSLQAGIGLDYRLNARFSLRAETDWVRTQFFNEVQNNFQGVVAGVFHF